MMRAQEKRLLAKKITNVQKLFSVVDSIADEKSM
jgi:hypothetical protein